MCANLVDLRSDVAELQRLGVDFLHIDIMDGHFVPNLTFGPDTVNAIRRITDMPFDIHMLMEQPRLIVRSLDIREGDIVTIHSECSESIMENVAFIKQKKALFGLALNPDTDIEEVRKYLPYTDVVLLMLIVPGFAGSTMIHGMMEKVTRTKEYLRANGFDNILIEVDGSVSAERAQYMASLGADIFVGGTAGVFRAESPLSDTVPTFLHAIGR